MADEPKFDFGQFVREAALEAKADINRNCWPWSHKWGAWHVEERGGVRTQARNCSHCNKRQEQHLSDCQHEWKFETEHNIVDNSGGLINKLRVHVCKYCGSEKKSRLLENK